MEKGAELFKSKFNPFIFLKFHKIFFPLILIHIILIILVKDIQLLLLLLLYPIIAFLVNWSGNLTTPVLLIIYERGIEIPSKNIFLFLIKNKIFIPFESIKIIYPSYSFNIKDWRKPPGKREYYFYGFKIILKNNKKYLIATEDYKKIRKFAPIIKNLIGEQWDVIFDFYYLIKNISKKELKHLNNFNKTGRSPDPHKYLVIMGLIQLYKMEMKKNILNKHSFEINEKYDCIWKNIEKIPIDFKWENKNVY